MEYKIIRAQTIVELQDKVSNNIGLVWQPLGGVSHVKLPGQNTGSDLLQTMIKVQ